MPGAQDAEREGRPALPRLYKQGRRVGVFGILADGKLTVAWFDGGKCTGPKFAASAPWGCEPL